MVKSATFGSPPEANLATDVACSPRRKLNGVCFVSVTIVIIAVALVGIGVAPDACEGILIENVSDCEMPRINLQHPNATQCFQAGFRGHSAVLLYGLADEGSTRSWRAEDWQTAFENVTLPMRSARLASKGGGQIEASPLRGQDLFSTLLNQTEQLVFSSAHKDRVVHEFIHRGVFKAPELMLGVSANPVLSIGGIGAGLQYHQHEESWLAVLYGAKKWYIRHPYLRPQSLHKRANELELAEEVGVIQCVQHPGEVLYLPTKWWHATYNVPDQGSNITIGWGGNGQSEGLRGLVLQGNVSALEMRSQQAQVSDEHFPDLMRAASLAGHVQATQWLIRQRANPSTQSESGADAMFGAVRGGHVDVVSLLVHHNAKVDVEDWGGHQPIHEAARQGHSEILSLLHERGAAVDAMEKGIFPVHAASAAGHVDALDWLVKRQADTNKGDANGITSMHAAFINGHVAVASWLSQHGAYFNATAYGSDLPVHLAVSRNQVDALSWYFRVSKPSPEILQDLISRAQFAGHNEIANFLKEQNHS